MGNAGNVEKRLGHMNNSINLDISHRCTLECPKCLRSFYKSNDTRVPGYDMTVDEYVKVIGYFKHINFCGNVSDPVFNPHLITFLKLNYERAISCEVHNAATGKPLSWYKRAFEANPKARWIFGLDGFPEDSHQYRINQDGEALFDAMKLCASMGLDTTWRCIVFKYNESHIKQCQRIANYYGVKFEQVHSSRFTSNDPYKPTSLFIERDFDQHVSQMSIR